MEGKLFSQDFLLDGIKTTPVWEALSETVLDTFIGELNRIYAPLSADSKLNEANTETDIIEKVLDLLDWRDLTLKQINASSKRRDDVPDFLLFPHEEAKLIARAEAREDNRYRHGIAILEAKKWMRPLDRGDTTNRLDPGTPSNQMLRYLSSVEVASERKVRWGILTNGAMWRLYWQGARSRSEEFLELNLAELLGVPGIERNLFNDDARHGLKLFFCLFHLGAFLRQTWDKEARTFHEYAFNEARLYEEKVSQDLGARVFATIFPQLADALAAGDPEAKIDSPVYLDELREATLVLLYRLLFILYAEDRNLLPARDERYDDYALRKIRLDIAKRRDENDTLSATACRYWQHVGELFRIVSEGDASIGMPAYNGGLFEEKRAPLLVRARVSDARFAPLFDDLARRPDILRAWINYRDLSVQHLGGIYERLLEYSLAVEEGKIVARPASFARKTSGSYYTHDGLVKLIIREAVGPLVEERKAAFGEQLAHWHRRHELKRDDWEALDKLDPAAAILDLKICDPAMGSGHFLVSLVDYLADEILQAMAEAEYQVATQLWAKDIANPWTSPLVTRIADIRKRIQSAARQGRWAVTDAQLDDRHIVRRMILKRVIYGVDMNPMAVELAKVALWLHTFTVGAPLSFLDHHLRCGDSLFGGRVRNIAEELAKLKGSLLQQGDLGTVQAARLSMETIGSLTDIDIAEAHRSKAIMDQITGSLAPLWWTLDFLQAQRWEGKAATKDYQQAWVGLLAQEYGENLLESISLLAKPTIKLFSDRQREAHATVQRALNLAEQRHFLHWELAFPTVFAPSPAGGGLGGGRTPLPTSPRKGEGQSPPPVVGPGFDAIIGNPPWDVMKLQEIEWFAERRPQIAQATNAADRKHLIADLEKQGDPLWQDFLAAQANAEIASQVARTSGDYPLLSGGDVNLYKLFVERAQSLIHKRGAVGLLCPSGIAADKGAAEFFRSISSTGRLSALFDFENRKGFFPDVDSRFKFCALIFGGEQRTVPFSRCAFYLHTLEEADDPTRILTLTAQDFSAVNPNTGAAPIFRTRRDADITTAIYRHQPVLTNRSIAPMQKVWPVRYCNLFHMAGDSGLFHRRDRLESEGWYPVEGKRWKKGEAEAVPLYEGKMVQVYDHRAAHIIVNPDNTFRAAQQRPTSIAEHADPAFLAEPQYWINADEMPVSMPASGCIAFKDVTSPTNMRTVIAAWIPYAGAGHTLPLLLPDETLPPERYVEFAPLVLANLNSFALDFLARQKVQGQHLMLYVLEQLPLIRPEQFQQTLPLSNFPPQAGERANEKGKLRSLADFVRGEVLRLSYTAHDLAPFARDLGYDGPPFQWDEEDRRHRLCRLDALFFHLYGISRDDAAYILDTFPIVREQDEKGHGRYLTKDLILAYMNAVAAGDFTTVVRV